MHRLGSQLMLTAVALILGFLVVFQIHAQSGAADLGNRSAQELTVLVANLNTRNDQLRTEIATLDRELGDLQAGQSRGQTSVDQLRHDLARIKAWAGLLPVTGRGIRVRIDGPIHAGSVDDLLNELRNAGAEAISVGGVRYVPGVVVAGQPGALSIDGKPAFGSVEIDAIGDPGALAGTLTRTGGLVAQLGATEPGAAIAVEPADRLDIAATTRSLRPPDAVPRL
ncbi:MAG TPA: DUF881 domain-containing protein [Candidatus Limnocylindrales bacterium]|nr:DUF881 domain-containing protein [Candidatus Limnocylindrales bacterium]